MREAPHFSITDDLALHVARFCVFLFDIENVNFIERAVYPFAQRGFSLFTDRLKAKNGDLLQKIFSALLAKISSSSVKVGYLLMFSYFPCDYLLERNSDLLSVLMRFCFFIKVLCLFN